MDASSNSKTPRDWKGWLDRADGWLAWVAPLALAIFAFFYYQQYYISGLNLGGEGGTNAVIAMRLLEGQRPIVDTFLGYNVMWFYPLVWLFQIVGPDFTAMRIFFYVLCALTGLMAYGVVHRVTRQAWLGVTTAVLVILLPGMLFRNYMGLLPVLNVFVLLHAFVYEAKTPVGRFLWYVTAGLALGLTYLVRIDVGVFFTPIYAGAVLLWPLGWRGQFWRRIPEIVAAMLTVVTVAVALHVPFWLDSRERGFEEHFLGQYKGIWGLIQYEAQRQIFDRFRGADMSAPAGGQGDWMRVANSASDFSAEEVGDGTLGRPPVQDIWGSGSLYDRSFVFALYMPVPLTVITLLVAAAGLLTGVVRRNTALKNDALAVGIALGGALTLFPQYFFFRPDVPHLGEFRIPFLVAMACACWFAVRWMWHGAIQRGIIIAFIGLCVVWETAYFAHAYWRDSSGSVRVRHGRTAEFTAENNVHVFVRRADLSWLEGLRDAVLDHSEPHEWVVTFPYSPTINFMTNRRSYLRNLYVDNATAPRDFHERTVEEIRQFRPAVIVIDDRAINQTEFSRFSNWAAPTLEAIRDQYVEVGMFQTHTVYARPDKVRAE